MAKLWKNKRVLVTDAGGFIASHFIEHLISLGAQTRAFTLYNSTNLILMQERSPYAASKISADKIAVSFYLSYDLPAVTLRPFNTYCACNQIEL